MNTDMHGAELEGRTVLLLEDEALIVLDLRLALEEGGARVLSSATLEGAYAHLARLRPHAAVLDIRLGGGDTCEPLAERLAALGVPFLLYSGDRDSHRALVERLGAPRLVKPFPSHQLAERVARLIDEGAAEG